MSLNQVPVKRKKAECCDKNTEIMLKVCIEEVNAENKPHNHFTQLGWANIAKNFNKATNLRYEYKQFRNRWNSLKKEWQLWAKLIGKDNKKYILVNIRFNYFDIYNYTKMILVFIHYF